MEKEIALVCMVAGLAKRFEGGPKWIEKVGPQGESFIEYSINQALTAGFTKIIFIVSKKTKPLFEEIFRDNYKGIPVYYALQNYDSEKRDKPWGTVDALCCAKPFLDYSFVVFGGDDILGENTFKILVEHLKNKSTSAAPGYKLSKVIPDKGNVNRAIFDINSDNTVKKLVEVFDISKENLESKGLSENSLCSMNIFALTSQDLDLLDKVLQNFKEKHKDNRTIECLLPNEISKLIKEKKLTMNLYPTNDKWFGITNPEDEAKVKEALKILYKTN